MRATILTGAVRSASVPDMRGAVAVLGVLLIAALGVVGCGGGSGPSTRTAVTRLEPHSLGKMRAAIQRDVDANLKKLRAPAREIACVDKNVESMSEKQIAERLVEAGPPHP